MLLAYFVKDWGIGPPFLMRCEATHRVSGSTMTRSSRCCDVSESWPGVGQGDKFVLLDMTEEPEAEKAYSIQHKRNLMER